MKNKLFIDRSLNRKTSGRAELSLLSACLPAALCNVWCGADTSKTLASGQNLSHDTPALTTWGGQTAGTGERRRTGLEPNKTQRNT